MDGVSHIAPPTLTILLDHDNIAPDGPTLYETLTAWLNSLEDILPSHGTVFIKVRAYGGWYSKETTTEARFQAVDYYQNNCPIAFRANGRYCRVSFAFADHLLIATRFRPLRDNVPITHTVTTRHSPYVASVRPDAPQCSESACQLTGVRKWIRKRRACFQPGCPHPFSEQFQRREQKQVDIHLAVDLLTILEDAGTGDHVGIATDDLDMAPALASAALRKQQETSITWLRFNSASTYLDPWLRQKGIRLLLVPSTSGA